MRKKYEMSVSEKERIVKFLLCSAAGLTYAALIGDPYGATTAVTANLILYVDRGFCGSVLYGLRRFSVQALQGALALAAVYLLKYRLHVPLPDTVIAIAAASFAIVIGLPLNYRYYISPFNTTLANATFIMVCGILKSPGFYITRLNHCFVGAMIGLVINWVIMPKHDRCEEGLREMAVCCDYLKWKIDAVCAPSSAGAAPVSEKRYRDARETAATHMRHLRADNGKMPFQKKRGTEQLAAVQRLWQGIGAMDSVLADVRAGWDGETAEFQAAFREQMNALAAALRVETERLRGDALPAPVPCAAEELRPESEAQLLLVSDLVRLRACLPCADAAASAAGHEMRWKQKKEHIPPAG